jgi:tRNA A-37 threonylcarbamoyl transferase component Bud32
VKDQDTNPTLLQCFACMMSLARQSCDCPSPPPSRRTLGDYPESPEEKDDDNKDPTYQPPGSGKGGRGSGRGDASKKTRNQPNTRGERKAPANKQSNRGELKLERFGWDAFEIGEPLGLGRCGKVFEGTFRGERVAIKLTDLWQSPELHEEMLKEARTYVELEKLQGHGIPKLKGVGYASGLFALITELGGRPIEVGNLNDEKREMIVGALASIHSEGFLHGDLRCENILIEHYHGDPRITFIDFGFSRKFSDHKESDREMADLQRMIGFRSMKKRRLV